MNVFDGSALLAFLLDERGADTVESALDEGGVRAAANWSEVVQKSLVAGRDWPTARTLLLSYSMRVESVTAEDGEVAASLLAERPYLSLGDRLCLALGERLDAIVLTTDAAWGVGGRIRQIRE